MPLFGCVLRVETASMMYVQHQCSVARAPHQALQQSLLRHSAKTNHVLLGWMHFLPKKPLIYDTFQTEYVTCNVV